MLRPFVAVLAVAVTITACRASAADRQSAPIVQPGAPGQPSTVTTADKVLAGPRPTFTPADVRFMQGMIAHHAQALEMTTLLETRTASADMRKLAKRITVSQADEIKMMQEWLTGRGQALPDPHAHHASGGATLMPGMLSAEEMSRLAAAEGPAFDRLFLQFMIRHHDGALGMVRDLFATPGAGQESEVYAFASDVDADQRMEIERMRAMLKELQR